MNNAFAERVGLERDALDGRRFADFLGEDLCRWLAQMDLDGASSPASVGRFEASDAALGGSFSVTVARLMSQAGAAVGLVVVARDISDRARLEAERAAKIVRGLLVFAAPGSAPNGASASTRSSGGRWQRGVTPAGRPTSRFR